MANNLEVTGIKWSAGLHHAGHHRLGGPMLWTVTRCHGGWRVRVYMICGNRLRPLADVAGPWAFCWRALLLAFAVGLTLRDWPEERRGMLYLH